MNNFEELSAAKEKPKPISFDELADRVQLVTGGIRMSFDPWNCKGHQIVPFMNFNSLSRIVEMYRTAPQKPVVLLQRYSVEVGVNADPNGEWVAFDEVKEAIRLVGFAVEGAE